MVVKGKPLTIKQQWQKLKDELKDMNTKEKLEHLWTYYKWVPGIFLGVAFVIALVITSIVSMNQKLLLAGAIVNVDVNPDGYVMLQDGYFQRAGGREGKETVELRNMQFENPYTTTDQTYALDVYDSIMSMVAADVLDYIMFDDLALSFFLDPELLLDLRQLFSEQQLADMGSAVIWLQMENTGERIPMAIDISDTAFHERYMESDKPVYLAFGVTTPRQEACLDFWQYIKGGQTDSLQTVLAGAAVDVQLTPENKELLTGKLFEALGCEAGDQRVELTEQSLESTQVLDHLQAGLESGTLDYVIVAAHALEALQEAQLLDLGQLLSSHELAEMEDDLLYQDGVPVAVELPGVGYLAFSANTKHLEACKALWSLLGE